MTRILLILIIFIAISCQTKKPNDSSFSNEYKIKQDSIREKDSLMDERVKFLEESEKFENLRIRSATNSKSFGR